MAFTVGEVLISGTIGEDVSSNQYSFVTLQSDGNYDLTGDGLQAHGIVTGDEDTAGHTVSIAVPNGAVTRVLAGGSISVGDNVASDANGAAVTATSGDVILGIAREAASGSGSVIAIQFFGYLGPA